MFSHVTIGSNDIARAKAFYDGVAAPLGLQRHADYPEAVGYGRAGGRPQLWVLRPLDKNAASVGNGITVGLEAESRSAVDAAYAAALKAGGKDEGAPGLRKHYHPNYYGAYVRDLDGNKVCIVCHKPA
jgi:catechol 2,3-dioxygenase-like lactoylglutathione lyase family enzyme